MSSNGRSIEEIEQAREREHERGLEQQAHSANLGQMFEGTEVELLRELMKSDLDPGTVRVLDNYISPDFLLSKTRQKEIGRFEWQLETKLLRVFDMHPPQEGVSGKARSYYYDDHRDVREPLDPQQRERIRSYKDGILSRFRRSEGGFQQDKIGESTSRVETVSRDDEDEKGRVMGILG